MVEHSSGQRVGTGVVGKGLIELTDFQVESRHEGFALVRRLPVKPLRIQTKNVVASGWVEMSFESFKAHVVGDANTHPQGKCL